MKFGPLCQKDGWPLTFLPTYDISQLPLNWQKKWQKNQKQEPQQ